MHAMACGMMSHHDSHVRFFREAFRGKKNKKEKRKKGAKKRQEGKNVFGVFWFLVARRRVPRQRRLPAV
jgi:hypothetical protein